MPDRRSRRPRLRLNVPQRKSQEASSGANEKDKSNSVSDEARSAVAAILPEANAATGSPTRDKDPGSDRSGAHSPDQNCAICLGKLENKSFTDSCLHMFCFVCLLEWSKVKPVCPLCQQQFKRIIHNVRSIEDFEEYEIPLEQPSWENPGGARFRYRTTLTSNRLFQRFESLLRPTAATTSVTTRSQWRNRRQNATADFRRRVYRNGMRVRPNLTGRVRSTSAEFYRENPATTHRLIPWLNRELLALFNNQENVHFLLELLIDLIKRFDIRSEEFLTHIQPYVGSRTAHFIHEFYNYARSPYDMVRYDEHAIYDQPEVVNDDTSDSDDSDVMVLGQSEILPNVSTLHNYAVPSGEHMRPQSRGRREPPAERRGNFPEITPFLLEDVQNFLDIANSIDDGTNNNNPRRHFRGEAGTANSGWESPIPFLPPLTELPQLSLNDLPLDFSMSASNAQASGTNLTAIENNDNNGEDSNDSDVMIIGFEKAKIDRTPPTPILISSGSDDSIDVVSTSKKKKHKRSSSGHDRHRRKHHKRKRSRSDSRRRHRSRSRARESRSYRDEDSRSRSIRETSALRSRDSSLDEGRTRRPVGRPIGIALDIHKKSANNHGHYHWHFSNRGVGSSPEIYSRQRFYHNSSRFNDAYSSSDAETLGRSYCRSRIDRRSGSNLPRRRRSSHNFDQSRDSSIEVISQKTSKKRKHKKHKKNKKHKRQRKESEVISSDVEEVCTRSRDGHLRSVVCHDTNSTVPSSVVKCKKHPTGHKSSRKGKSTNSSDPTDSVSDHHGTGNTPLQHQTKPMVELPPLDVCLDFNNPEYLSIPLTVSQAGLPPSSSDPIRPTMVNDASDLESKSHSYPVTTCSPASDSHGSPMCTSNAGEEHSLPLNPYPYSDDYFSFVDSETSERLKNVVSFKHAVNELTDRFAESKENSGHLKASLVQTGEEKDEDCPESVDELFDANRANTGASEYIRQPDLDSQGEIMNNVFQNSVVGAEEKSEEQTEKDAKDELVDACCSSEIASVDAGQSDLDTHGKIVDRVNKNLLMDVGEVSEESTKKDTIDERVDPKYDDELVSKDLDKCNSHLHSEIKIAGDNSGGDAGEKVEEPSKKENTKCESPASCSETSKDLDPHYDEEPEKPDKHGSSENITSGVDSEEKNFSIVEVNESKQNDVKKLEIFRESVEKDNISNLIDKDIRAKQNDTGESKMNPESVQNRFPEPEMVELTPKSVSSTDIGVWPGTSKDYLGSVPCILADSSSSSDDSIESCHAKPTDGCVNVSSSSEDEFHDAHNRRPRISADRRRYSAQSEFDSEDSCDSDISSEYSSGGYSSSSREDHSIRNISKRTENSRQNPEVVDVGDSESDMSGVECIGEGLRTHSRNVSINESDIDVVGVLSAGSDSDLEVMSHHVNIIRQTKAIDLTVNSVMPVVEPEWIPLGNEGSGSRNVDKFDAYCSEINITDCSVSDGNLSPWQQVEEPIIDVEMLTSESESDDCVNIVKPPISRRSSNISVIDVLRSDSSDGSSHFSECKTIVVEDICAPNYDFNSLSDTVNVIELCPPTQDLRNEGQVSLSQKSYLDEINNSSESSSSPISVGLAAVSRLASIELDKHIGAGIDPLPSDGKGPMSCEGGNSAKEKQDVIDETLNEISQVPAQSLCSNVESAETNMDLIENLNELNKSGVSDLPSEDLQETTQSPDTSDTVVKSVDQSDFSTLDQSEKVRNSLGSPNAVDDSSNEISQSFVEGTCISGQSTHTNSPSTYLENVFVKGQFNNSRTQDKQSLPEVDETCDQGGKTESLLVNSDASSCAALDADLPHPDVKPSSPVCHQTLPYYDECEQGLGHDRELQHKNESPSDLES